MKAYSMDKENEKITDKDVYIEQLRYAVSGSESTFNMLRDILTKFFPILFYLNGGAAIAILAFLGNLVGYNDKYLFGVLNSLGCFAFGAFLTAVSLGISYISQCYYQECSEKYWQISWIGKFVSNDYFIKDSDFRRGKKYRGWAIASAVISGLFFLLGCITFACTFRLY